MAQTQRIAVVAGATGLVGGLLVNELLEGVLARATFHKIVTVGRKPTRQTHERPIDKDVKVPRPLPDGAHPRLDERVVDLLAMDGALPDVTPTDLFCCLGTTIAKAGSQEAFRKVDHDMVVSFARWGRARGAERFFLVTAVNTNVDSSAFYSRVKGEVERDVKALGFPILYAFRPSMILGDREERRPLEAVAIAGTRILNPILVGGLRKLRGIEPLRVAKAMVAASVSGTHGNHVVEYDEMVRLAALT